MPTFKVSTNRPTPYEIASGESGVGRRAGGKPGKFYVLEKKKNQPTKIVAGPFNSYEECMIKYKQMMQEYREKNY